MTEAERKAILTVIMLAASADGRHDETERAAIARIADSLTKEGPIDAAAIQHDVEQSRVTVAAVASAITSPEAKQLAYESAVVVCTADGAQNNAEQSFLSDLRAALQLDAKASAATEAFTENANAAAVSSLATVTPLEPAASRTMSTEEMDRVILNYAILTGALEILPDTMATLAIVPLQMKMVYRIGQSYGVTLDRSHIKDFAATAGIGLSSQFVEQIGVKLVGGILGGLFGRLAGAVGRQTTSSGFSFATTYALGRLASKYYAGGRTLSTAVLKDTYAGLLNEAKGMQGHYWEAMQNKASTLDVRQIIQDIRS